MGPKMAVRVPEKISCGTIGIAEKEAPMSSCSARPREHRFFGVVPGLRLV